MIAIISGWSQYVAWAQDFREPDLGFDVGDGIITTEFFELFEATSGLGYDRILGNNAIAPGETGIDAYKIVIKDAASFYVRDDLKGSLNTKAFLFDTTGNAVMANDDDPEQGMNQAGRFGFRDLDTHIGAIIGQPSNVANGEVYILAIGTSGDIAEDVLGVNLFLSDGGDSEALVGPSAAGTALRDWVSSGSGEYQVSLSGALMFAYSQSAGDAGGSFFEEFEWIGGGGDGLMSNPDNWFGPTAPTNGGGPLTDITGQNFSESFPAINDLSALAVRSFDIDCKGKTFTLLDDATETVVCSNPYGRIGVSNGLGLNRFIIGAPVFLECDATAVAVDGEFFIDGELGRTGTVLGARNCDNTVGARFRGTGRLTFNGVGSSMTSMPMDYFNSEAGLEVVFAGDNQFFVADPANIAASLIRGDVIFDSKNDGGITNGDHRFEDTNVMIEGGGVFTLNTGPGRFRFSSSMVTITDNTELFCERGFVTGGNAIINVQAGSILRNGGVEIRPCIIVDQFATVAGVGTFRDNILVNGAIAPGDLVDFDIGTLEVEGDIDMSRTTITCIELGGSTSGTYDEIVGGLNYHLDGRLQLSLVNGFIPSDADEYIIMTSATTSGQFADVQPAGFVSVEYGADPGFVRLYNIQSPLISAKSFNVETGTVAAGTIEDAQTTNDVYLQLYPGGSPVSGPPASVVFDATLPDANPGNLSLRVESQANTPGLQQQIEAFNWVTGEYEVVDVQSPSILTDAVVDVDLNTNLASYIDIKGNVRMRVSWDHISPVLMYPWQISVDQVVWIAN